MLNCAASVCTGDSNRAAPPFQRHRRSRQQESPSNVWAYIVLRIRLTIPIVLGVLLITMLLFSYVAHDPAPAWAGKFVTEGQLESIREKMGLDKPRWFKWSVPVRRVEVDQSTVKITSSWRHGLDSGDRVVVKGVGPGYDGTHAVASVAGPKVFTSRAAQPPPPAPTDLTHARIHNGSLWQRLAGGFDSQLFDILTFRIYNRVSMRYDERIWDILMRKAPASMSIQIPAFLIALGLELG